MIIIPLAILVLGSIIYSQEVSISFGAVDEAAGTMEILMTNPEDAIAYFTEQLNIYQNTAYATRFKTIITNCPHFNKKFL